VPVIGIWVLTEVDRSANDHPIARGVLIFKREIGIVLYKAVRNKQASQWTSRHLALFFASEAL